MRKEIKILVDPGEFNHKWDELTTCFLQKRNFLSFLHKYNYCNQRYYELYNSSELCACAIVYTLRVDLFTFSRFSLPLYMQVIGLPLSVSCSGIFGDSRQFSYLLKYILDKEKGMILGLNFNNTINKIKTVKLRTLPTVEFKNDFVNWENYLKSIRSNYRRSILKHQKKFGGIKSVSGGCSSFTKEHYYQYLKVLDHSTTKLERIKIELFQNLPEQFILNSFYDEDKLICWNIICPDKQKLYFLFGGLDYYLRDRYSAYYNNLLEIIQYSIKNNYGYVDLGQTAEKVKQRLGGKINELSMFLYNSNPLAYFTILLLRKFITYSNPPPIANVFHKNKR